MRKLLHALPASGVDGGIRSDYYRFRGFCSWLESANDDDDYVNDSEAKNTITTSPLGV